MRYLGFGVVSIATAITLMGACVGDSATVANPAPEGSNGGPCFKNGTCNAGLTCTLVNGSGVCKPGGDPQDASLDQSNPQDTSVVESSADAGLPNCNVMLAQPFVDCQGGQTCFDPFQPNSYCSACNGLQLWSCSAGSQCAMKACCLTQTGFKLTPPSDLSSCGTGTAVLSNKASPTEFGGMCKSDCSQDLAQLCLKNTDCPPNKWCAPYTVTQGPPKLMGDTLGFCTK